MRVIRIHILGMTLLLCAAGSAQMLDRIVATVGDEIILQSDLNAQIQFHIFNNRIDPNTPGLRDQVLQAMINEKLIVAKAIEDTVVVSDDEVQQQLDQVIKQRIQQVGSESRLEEIYGMPLSRIKREFRDEMRKQLIASRLQQQQFGQTQISRREVEEFYNVYKDSIGQIPEEVELAHIFVTPKFDEDSRKAAHQKLELLRDSLNSGVSFADLATRHSEDPGSARQGGELGLVRRGLFVKEFEAAVFALNEGQVSDIIETQYGMHIIQLKERRGDAVIARHMLIRITHSEKSNKRAMALLDSLRDRALAGESFAELAKKYSEDKETAQIGGSLGGLVDLEQQTDKGLYPTIVNLKEGEISAPSSLQNGYHIVLMKRRVPAHNVTLEVDFHRLESLALNFKRSEEYNRWLQELREKIYWKIRM